MGLAEHLHGDPNRVLCVLTSGTKRIHIGTLGTHTGYAACSHGACRKEPRGAIVRAGSEAGSLLCWRLLCCVCASGMPLGTASEPGDERREYRPGDPTPRVGSTTWCPAWGTRSVHMGLTLARPAHSHARARNARAHARVRMSVHCEPLPSRSNASLAPH
jgi:hypothetical protein